MFGLFGKLEMRGLVPSWIWVYKQGSGDGAKGDSLLSFWSSLAAGQTPRDRQGQENSRFQAKPASVAPVERAFNQHPSFCFPNAAGKGTI